MRALVFAVTAVTGSLFALLLLTKPACRGCGRQRCSCESFKHLLN